MIIDKIEIGGIILMDINKSDMLRGLYGSKISRNKCVGYCYLHKCHLTAKTLKRHECLKKQCNCLKKHEENNYWKQREQIKNIRKGHSYVCY